jgi:signal transduction histidine kinase
VPASRLGQVSLILDRSTSSTKEGQTMDAQTMDAQRMDAQRMDAQRMDTQAMQPPVPMTAPPPNPAAGPRPQGALTTFLLSPISGSTWRAVVAIILGFIVSIASFSIVASLFSAGASVLLFLIGIPVIALGIEVARLTARIERWRMTLIDDRPLIARPYRSLDPNPTAPLGTRLRAWAEAEFLDSSRWYDIAYVVVAFPLAIIEFVASLVLWSVSVAFLLTPLAFLAARSVGSFYWPLHSVVGPGEAAVIFFVIGLVLLPIAASATRGMAVLHRSVVEGILCLSPAEALRRDNERLRGSRAATVELEAAELRRVERDIHDGAQQRLVSLAIDLALAEGKVDSDPEVAKTLVAGARDQARQALADLRDVVRGTAPAILLDRGLGAALAAVAGRSAIPTYVDDGLAPGTRLSPAVERAAYFAVSEALTNVAKHGGATRADVALRRDVDRLTITIRDDGQGGAAITEGGGLAGLRDRVEALDGSLAIESPAGGPTMVTVELPLGAA